VLTAEQQRIKRQREEDAKRRRESNYGNSSSYTPATDYGTSYTPPAPDPSPGSDYSGGGGSFDGGGSSGDY
jgi:uncharacterized membrane protein YgcG